MLKKINGVTGEVTIVSTPLSQPKSNEEAKKLIKKHVDAMTALAILDTKSDLWEQAWEELDAFLDGILAQKDAEAAEAQTHELDVLAVHLDRQLAGYTSVNLDSIYRYIEERQKAIHSELDQDK